MSATSGGKMTGGSLPAAVALTIPPNSLTADVSVAIAEVNEDEISLPMVPAISEDSQTKSSSSAGPTFTKMPAAPLQFTPHGLTFTTPVTIEIPYKASAIQSNDKACMLKAPNPDATQWTEYCDGLTFNNGVMTTAISSFSVISIGVTDLTAPTISSVSVVKLRNRGDALRLSFKVDEECPVHYVVLVGGSATPTATQVVSGQAADGTTVQQVDPRIAPVVHQSGVLSYDSDDSSILQFTIKGLVSESTYDIHVVGQDAQGNLGTTLMLQQDTADVTPPEISIFEDAGHKYYKRGSPIAQDFFTAFDSYDGDLTEKVLVVGTLSTQEDISSVKLRVSDSSGNTAVTYVTCNCATCYKGQQTASASILERGNLITDKEESVKDKRHHNIELEDGRVMRVNSKLAGEELKKYQKMEKTGKCHCKCKKTNGLHGAL